MVQPMPNTIHAYITRALLMPKTPDLDVIDKPTTSKKRWATPFTSLDFHDGPEELENFFNEGNDPDLDDADMARLNQSFLLPPVRENVKNEGEVSTMWKSWVRPAVMVAWRHVESLRFRSQMPVPFPLPPGMDATMVVDEHIQLDIQNDETGPVLVATEFKTPGVLDQDEWTGNIPLSAPTVQLGKELVGYAYAYNTRVMCCFDSLTLVMLRWRGGDREAIKTTQPTVFVVVVDQEETTVPVVYYAAIRDQYQRYVGGLAADHGSKTYGGATFCRDRDGRPYWKAPNGRTSRVHPHLPKTLDVPGRQWVWRDEDGEPFQICVVTIFDTSTDECSEELSDSADPYAFLPTEDGQHDFP